jgi:hypothetical protein
MAPGENASMKATPWRGPRGSSSGQGRTVLTLVKRARRRLFHNELFSQGAYAAVAILVAVILLLLFGTRILDWRWLLVVGALAAAFTWLRARRRLPSPYAAAQVVDRRLELADTISTAVYFQQEPSRRVSAPVRQFQLERANQLCASVDLRRAVPYTMPRGVYPVAVLVLVAGSLFALRYGLMGRLDLQPPLAHVLQQQLGWNERTEVAGNKQPPRQAPNQPDDAASLNDPDRSQSVQPDTGANDASDATNDSSAEKNAPAGSDAKKDGNRAGKSSADEDQDARAESSPAQSDEKSGREEGKADRKQPSGGKPEAGTSGENSSLMNKAKDLLQNLLSSLKPPNNNPGNQQQSDANNQPGKGQPRQQNDKSGQQQASGQKGDQSEGQQGEEGQDQQDQSQQGNGKNDARQASKQPGSGAGNQDGDKRIKQAADLAAMGKITEILGKRSASLTGEATVVVQSTSQQLRTPYAPGAAQHGQSGGEINRDEIPAAIAPFVQEYFRQARKPAAPASPPPAPAAKQQ